MWKYDVSTATVGKQQKN